MRHEITALAASPSGNAATTAIQFEAGWASELVLTFLQGFQTQFNVQPNYYID
jgi:hypothetical protein